MQGPAGSWGTGSSSCPARPLPPSPLCPRQRPAQRLWKGAPTILELCCLLRGLPHSGLQCRRLPGRASAQPGRGTQTSPPQRLWGSSSLPSGPVLAAVRSLPARADQTGPFAFSSFLVLLRDELLPWFPPGNLSFQQAVGSRGPGWAAAGPLGLAEVWGRSRVLCPSLRALTPSPTRALPLPHPHGPASHPTLLPHPSRSQVWL